MRSLTYVGIKYIHFYLCKWNWGTDFIFHKTKFGNSKKLESIVNIFVFFTKISCQSKESPLSKQFHPYSPTPLFLEEIFHPHPFCQIRAEKLRKGEGLVRTKDFLCALKFLIFSSALDLKRWNKAQSDVK